MYKVIYTENNEKKEKICDDRDAAFGFQNELLVKRIRFDNGSWSIEIHGVYKI
jgi:hypothetical protein